MIGGGFKIGRIFGIPIILDLSFFLIFFLVVWLMSEWIDIADGLQRWGFAVLAGVVLFASLLVHELAHSLVARRLGLEVSSITLVFFGGFSMIKDDPERPLHEFAISVVGPLANLVIGGVLLAVALFALSEGSAAAQIVSILAALNLAVGIFNLLPGYPLDGGHIFRALIWKLTGSPYRATRAAAALGQIFAAAVVIVGMLGVIRAIDVEFLRGLSGIWLAVIGFLLWTQARQAAKSAELQHDLRARRVDELMLQPNADRTLDSEAFVIAIAPDRRRLDHREAFFASSDGVIVGILPASTILLLDDSRYRGSKVRDVMIPAASLTPLPPEARADEALKRLQGEGAPRMLPVVEHGRLLGLVGIDQIIAGLRRPRPLRPGA